MQRCRAAKQPQGAAGALACLIACVRPPEAGAATVRIRANDQRCVPCYSGPWWPVSGPMPPNFNGAPSKGFPKLAPLIGARPGVAFVHRLRLIINNKGCGPAQRQHQRSQSRPPNNGADQTSHWGQCTCIEPTATGESNWDLVSKHGSAQNVAFAPSCCSTWAGLSKDRDRSKNTPFLPGFASRFLSCDSSLSL